MNIVPQHHWDHGYDNFLIQKAPENDPITELIKNNIPIAKLNQQAFEIGCFPGRFLCVLGDLGYVLNGVDTTPHIEKFKNSLDALGYKTNKFEHKDFEKTQKVKYDVVASFGFIEHFTNWSEVIKIHTEFVDKNGYLIITTPNFKGLFQYIYHRIFDNDNLKRHVVASMSPKKWKAELEKSGLEITSFGYTGFGFWDESNKRNLFYRVIKKGTTLLFKCIHKIKPNHSSIGSYCYIIAKNK
jgi:2-polyprenyl-3-methyl-5-hydroxy-6-metoxy-1,4-benzoquinol methylase